jgi:hypothetical protein
MRNDTPRPTESEGDSNDASSSMRGMAAHIAASGPTPPAYPNQYGSVPNAQQFSFMDPNVMMMNSAAATIAAVAASAVHQMAQGKNGQSGVNGSTSLVPPALVAALQGARGNQLVPTHSAGNTAVHPHVAALFGSAACGQLQMQNSVVAAPVPSQFHHSLSSADSASTLHPSTAAAAHAAAGSMSNVLLPSMQTWNLVQLGKKTMGRVSYRDVWEIANLCLILSIQCRATPQLVTAVESASPTICGLASIRF